MKKLKKFIFKFSKKIIFKYLMTFSLIFTILFSSFCSCVSVSYGAEVLSSAGKIVGFIGSTLGIVDKAVGGGVTKMGGDTTSRIEEWWSDNFNNGEIYENASGEYVFSGTATQELYNALDSDSSIDARVISSFSGTRFFNSPYINYGAFNAPVSTWLTENNISDYLVLRDSVHFSGSGDYFSKYIIVDLSDVAYVLVSDSDRKGMLKFYNSNGDAVRCNMFKVSQIFSSNDFQSVGTSSFTNTQVTFYFCYLDIRTVNYDQNLYFDSPYWNVQNDGSVSPSWNDYENILPSNFVWNNFPFVSTMNGISTSKIFSNRSVIFAKDSVSAMQMYNQNTGHVINNYYSTLPSVSKTVLENNDWDSIYNSYVNNVSNESNTYYNSETDSYDDTALRKAMKKYTDNIENAISSGAEDIAEQVNYLNEWMSKIYSLLGQIADLIDQNETGGSSGATDLTTIEGKLSAIQNYLETISGDTLEIKNLVSNLEDINNQLSSMQGDLDYIQDNYVILSNIYNYMLANPWGGSGHFKEPTDQPYEKWFNYLDDDDFPYGEILSKYNVLEQLLKGAAPFCFFAFVSLVVNSLDVPAVEPVFDIPVQMNNNLITVDEVLTIDLTIFDSILPVTNALVIILWTMVLLWSSFYLISHLLTILQL